MKLRNMFLAALLFILVPCTAYPAWLFDSTTDYVFLADNATLTLPNGDWTIAGWVKLTSTSASLDIYPLRHDRVSGDGYEIIITSNGSATDEASFLVQSDNGTFISATSTSSPFLSNTDWTHFVLQRSVNTVTLYVNGTSVASASHASLDAVNSDENLYLGNRDNADRNLNGSLAEWAKWDRALSSDERAALAEGFSPNCFPGFQWYAPMIVSYQELVQDLTVTNNGTVSAPHQRLYSCN